MSGGTEHTAEEIVAKASRFKEYFGKNGGITISGGEPLLQADFVKEIFTLSKENGINTCLDTSGSLLNDSVKSLLEVTDRVLLDIKYTTDEDYQKYVGCSLSAPIEFLSYLNAKKIPTTLRQVIIPTLNDNEENILNLKRIKESHPNVDKIELLPFKKICQVKYDNMGINFPFAYLPEPDNQLINNLQKML
jgi:pyruvate formate lyase activating enzyme